MDLESPSTRRMHSIANRTRAKGSDFVNFKIGDTMAMDVIESSQIDWA